MSRALGLGAALALLSLAGCRSATEVVVVVSAGDLNIPGDVDTVGISVPSTGAGTPVLPLCPAGGAACLTLPLSATLVPGPARPDDPTTVLVVAQKGGRAVLRMGATFTFARGQRQRLDFTLYARCLGNLACADTTPASACGFDGTCVAKSPVALEADAAAPPIDLAAPQPDLTAPPPDLTASARDLAAPPDLATPPDFARVPSFIDNACIAAAGIAASGGFPASTCAAACASVGKSCFDTCTTNRGKLHYGVEAWVDSADCMAYVASGGEASCQTDLSMFSDPGIAKYRCCCQ